MSLDNSSVTRAIDVSGKSIKTFQDADSNEIQAIALVDADGNHIYFDKVRDGDSIVLKNDEGNTTTSILPMGGATQTEKVRFIQVQADGKLDIAQNEVLSLFHSMLKELKKINLYFGEMADDTFTNEDIE